MIWETGGATRKARLEGGFRHEEDILAAGTENVSRPALELRLPRCDLIGVHIELLRKLSKCAIALDGSKPSRTELHAFTHGTSCPSRPRRTSPKCP